MDQFAMQDAADEVMQNLIDAVKWWLGCEQSGLHVRGHEVVTVQAPF